MNFTKLLFVFFTFLCISSLSITFNVKKQIKKHDNINVQKSIIVQIDDPHPNYQNYNNIVKQLKEWENNSKELTEVGVYGKTTKGSDLYYIRINNSRKKENKPTVLITACIHGNEPLATSTTMWFIGSMLKQYNSNIDVKNLVDSRDIYFIPVVSPDSYPFSRYVDGVDPNRNFPTSVQPDKKSVKPVDELQKFFFKIKPNAVISGHTFGRVFLMPYGDKMMNSENHQDYKNIFQKMCELSGYKYMRVCDMYKSNGGLNSAVVKTFRKPINEYKVSVPIFGTEIDWYYRNNSFPIVIEYGTHQKIPSRKDIELEYKKTYEAVLYFIKEAPLINVNNK